MNKHIRNIIIFLIPFICMVIVNESYRVVNKNPKPYRRNGIVVLNPDGKNGNRCTWWCHDKGFCRVTHAKNILPFRESVRTFYVWIINKLKKTRDYQWANILVLGILWPLLMYVLVIKSLNITKKIKKIKQHTP